MKSDTQSSTFRCAAASLAALLMALGGCGSEEKKNSDFFTSGNPDADQRAEQRMAKSDQLKDSKSAFPLKTNENVSLYERLGGEKGINAIVDDFLPRAMADPRVNWDRKDVKEGGFTINRGRSVSWSQTPQNVQQLRIHLAQFFSLATGGPALYNGKEIKEAHAGLHITNAEFDACVGDLKASLDKMQIPVKEQKELLAIVETTRTQIAEER